METGFKILRSFLEDIKVFRLKGKEAASRIIRYSKYF